MYDKVTKEGIFKEIRFLGKRFKLSKEMSLELDVICNMQKIPTSLKVATKFKYI